MTQTDACIESPLSIESGTLLGSGLSIKARVINLCAVVIPFAGLVAAGVLLWGVALDWQHLMIFGGMYVLTGLGVTVGFHRLFTHRSFAAPKAVRFVLGALGSMAAQGPLLEWAATHRQHHQYSDREHDPHSPHDPSPHLAGVFRGVWHAHTGWLFDGRPRGLGRYVADLRRDRVVRVVSRTFPYWVLLGLLIPAILGGLLTQSWFGMLMGFIWGGLVRVFVVHHTTWSVNSVCHLWGRRTFRTNDESRDNAVVAMLSLGEGWHNSHHAFPTSARHGLGRWQLDSSYMVIRALGWVGLAHSIRVPTRERLEARRSPAAKAR